MLASGEMASRGHYRAAVCQGNATMGWIDDRGHGDQRGDDGDDDEDFNQAKSGKPWTGSATFHEDPVGTPRDFALSRGRTVVYFF
jgi:hypothetical protein